eukprot:1830825-Pleurochrysis_carterae.AAC.2
MRGEASRAWTFASCHASSPPPYNRGMRSHCPVATRSFLAQVGAPFRYSGKEMVGGVFTPSVGKLHAAVEASVGRSYDSVLVNVYPGMPRYRRSRDSPFLGRPETFDDERDSFFFASPQHRAIQTSSPAESVAICSAATP